MKSAVSKVNLPTAAQLFAAFAGSLEARRESASALGTALKAGADGHVLIYEDRESAEGSGSLLLFGEECGKTNVTKQSWSLELCGSDEAGSWKTTLRVSVVGECDEDTAAAAEALAGECREEASRLSSSLGETKPQVKSRFKVELGMVVGGAATREVIEQVRLYARESLPVLITGESGVGKERVAQGLHDKSGRRGQKITINCGCIPADLIGSKLFGHVKGAFTGANAAQKGAFEAADGGTLFLDEIGDMPLEQQVALLRVLQEGTITPIGSHTERRVNVRVVAATHCDLEKLVEDGRFRRDLYYRLRGLTIEIKPLRERRDEIAVLAAHHVEKMAAESDQPVTITEEALRALESYDWPGNVRELVMLLGQARIHARGGSIGVAELRLPAAAEPEPVTSVVRPFDTGRREQARRAVDGAAPAELYHLPAEMGTASFDQQMQAYERLVIERALSATGFNVKATADRLQLPHSTLRRRMLFHGIERPANTPRQRRYQRTAESAGAGRAAAAA